MTIQVDLGGGTTAMRRGRCWPRSATNSARARMSNSSVNSGAGGVWLSAWPAFFLVIARLPSGRQAQFDLRRRLVRCPRRGPEHHPPATAGLGRQAQPL
jgi:hypothetical protein